MRYGLIILLQLKVSDIQEPILKPSTSLIYNIMKDELSEKGYSDFRFLGQGAQALVILAKEQKTNRRYAIKGIHVRDSKGKTDQEVLLKAQKEIDLLNKCKGSPYVCNLLGQIEGEQFMYLILTECVGTLSNIIQSTQDRRLNELSAIKYSKDIAEGLSFVHSKNFIVNDLKMDNILIDYNGNAVISDFGLGDEIPRQSGCSFNQYLGNVMFQAPECYDEKNFDEYKNEYKKLGINVKREPSQRSEASSLGYLIYTLINGVSFRLTFEKHKHLQYIQEFYHFEYKNQLKYIIDGLTQFIPRQRMKVKDALIVLKGIISLEFNLDSKFIEILDEPIQKPIHHIKQEIEFVQFYEDKFYPIIEMRIIF